MRKLAPTIVTAAAVWLGVSAAQEPVIRGGVQLVDVLVTVRDRSGALLKDLKQSDFKIFEDGKQQEIRGFVRQSDVPLTIGMLVDISGSVAEQVGKERGAAGQFFRQVLRPQDKAFLISFAHSAVLLQDLTSSVEKLQDGLDDLNPAPIVNLRPDIVMAQFPMPRFPMPTPPPQRRGKGPGGGRGGTIRMGGTVLYDAVFLAADDVLRPASGRKAIILITDGVDQGSLVSLNTALETAQKHNVIIYSIQVRSAMGRIVEPLAKLSNETGGRVFKLEGNTTKIFAEISDELRSQYSISYVPSSVSEPGAYHAIDVQTVNKSYKPQARKGYYGARVDY